MKKVLIITYHFPPEGGAPVQRITKFVKYLPESGYQPYVLTARHRIRTVDPSLLRDVPDQIPVYKARDWGSYAPYEIRKLFKRFFQPDNSVFWMKGAIKLGIQLVREHGIDVIFSTSPPHSVQLAAKAIAQTSGRPWIADFRDEWTGNPLFLKKPYVEKNREWEKQVLDACSGITTICGKARDNFGRTAESGKIHVVRNGFDPDDFKGIEPDPSKNGPLEIVYCGRLNQLHSPKPFFSMLSRLCEKGELEPGRIKITIIGNTRPGPWCAQFPVLKNILDFTGYLPHDKCIQAMGRAGALLLLATSMNSTEMFPAKMYEYFRLKKPVYALISFPGELSTMLTDYGNAYIGLEEDQASIEAAFRQLLHDHMAGIPGKPVSEDLINGFNRKEQARQLAGILDSLI